MSMDKILETYFSFMDRFAPILKAHESSTTAASSICYHLGVEGSLERLGKPQVLAN